MWVWYCTLGAARTAERSPFRVVFGGGYVGQLVVVVRRKIPHQLFRRSDRETLVVRYVGQYQQRWTTLRVLEGF